MTTNVEIIEQAKQKNKIDCDVNTYGGWLSEGKKVKKGERAVFKAEIHKPYTYHKKGEEKVGYNKVNTAFFTENQVEEI